jgi:membrane fusion protein (multidrug efflux system)
MNRWLIRTPGEKQMQYVATLRTMTVTLAAALIVILACSGCSFRSEAGEGDDAKPDTEARKEEAVPVEVATVELGEIEAVLRFSANLEAERQVQVLAEAPRQVVKLLVEEGDMVSGGDLLVRLQDDVQRSNLARVESQLRKAQSEHQRQQELYTESLISEQVFNDTAYELEQLELSYDDARRELSYTEVKAPIAGTVTERLVNLGDHVTVNQPLFRVVDFDSIVARIYVPEKELPRLDPGQPARLTADALGTAAFDGSIERISPVVDPSSGTVKVTVATPRQSSLRPGMYVVVELVTDRHQQAALLPKRALVYDNDQIFVFRLGDERRVERVPVSVLIESTDTVEPVSGFAAGDQIVIAGQSGLKDGALVRLPGDPKPVKVEDEDDTRVAESEATTDDSETATADED